MSRTSDTAKRALLPADRQNFIGATASKSLGTCAAPAGILWPTGPHGGAAAVKEEGQSAPAFAPVSSAFDIGILVRFSTHQQDLIRRMRATAELPIEKIIITSVVSPFVTYTLLDAYRILVAHERRHLEQAERVMRAPGFPGE